ncbi:MAG: hypothetical protein QOF76_4081, partial [Solirubrobacteraceae bacterium]|nr:hypothetical protein [Solirubrobacteraceae bacterium]
LRIRAAYGALTFAAFSVLWSTLAVMLARSPYSYSAGTIGLFGLAAAMGAGAAAFGGRFADRGHVSGLTLGGLAAGLAGFVALEAGRGSLLALIAGILLVDFGGQLVQVASQGRIYQLGEGIRGRLTMAYMGTRFAGGVVGSALGVAVFASGDWHASTTLGAALYVAGLAVWWFERRVDSPVPKSGLVSQ